MERRRRQDPPPPPALETPLAETGLPLRVVNILEEEMDAVFVGDALKLPKARLLKLSGFGRKSLRQLIAAASRLGIRAPDDWLKD